MSSVNTLTPQDVLSNSSEVLKTLGSDQVWRSVPLISSLDKFDHLKEMQLVRFRGLIQDMMDPEIYLESFQTKNATNEIKMHSGKYRDNIKLEVRMRNCLKYLLKIMICSLSVRKMKKFNSIQMKMFTRSDDQYSWFRFLV